MVNVSVFQDKGHAISCVVMVLQDCILENKHLPIGGYCLILFFRLKTVNLVLKNTQAAEALVKLYETKLCEEETVIADKNNIKNLISTLKVWVSLLAIFQDPPLKGYL